MKRGGGGGGEENGRGGRGSGWLGRRKRRKKYLVVVVIINRFPKSWWMLIYRWIIDKNYPPCDEICLRPIRREYTDWMAHKLVQNWHNWRLHRHRGPPARITAKYGGQRWWIWFDRTTHCTPNCQLPCGNCLNDQPTIVIMPYKRRRSSHSQKTKQVEYKYRKSVKGSSKRNAPNIGFHFRMFQRYWPIFGTVLEERRSCCIRDLVTRWILLLHKYLWSPLVFTCRL